MRRRLALALVALLALAGVAALALTGPAELPPAEPAPPAGELGRFLPLTAGAEPLVLDFDWLAGEVRSIVVQREIPRWDRVDGKPCARAVCRRAVGLGVPGSVHRRPVQRRVRSVARCAQRVPLHA